MNCRKVIVVTICCWSTLSIQLACAQVGPDAERSARSPAIAMAMRPAELQGPASDWSHEIDDRRFRLSAFGSGPVDLAPSFDQVSDVGPVSFSITSLTQSFENDLGRFQETGAEVRLGQRLRESIGVYTSSHKPTWFVFAGGGGQAITYTPGASSLETPGGAVRLQDRVRVGRVQAGMAVEVRGVQAALAYVRREVNIGDENSRQQHFAGITLSFKH